MRDYQPFELLGPTQVYGAFYKQNADQQRAIAGLQGTTVKIASLSEMIDDFGEISSGIVKRGEDITIDITTSPATFTGSGEVGCWPPIEVLSGVYAVRFTLNAGVVTYYVSATDGKLYAGAGAVVLDDDGITILSINTPTSINQIKFVTDDAYQTGYYESYFLGTTPNRTGIIQIGAERESGAAGTGTSSIILLAHDGSATPSRLTITNDDSDPYLSFRDRWGNFGAVHWGDATGYAQVVAASTTPTSGYSRVIQTGSMGANGFFAYDAWFLVSNTGGTNVSATFAISFGGTTLHTVGSNATGASTPRYHLIHFVGVVANQNDAAVQRAGVTFDGSGTVLQDTAALSSVAASVMGIKAAAVNTGTGDRTFDISGTLSTATNSRLERLGVNFYGSCYQA